jgi:hypothetical protein
MPCIDPDAASARCASSLAGVRLDGRATADGRIIRTAKVDGLELDRGGGACVNAACACTSVNTVRSRRSRIAGRCAYDDALVIVVDGPVDFAVVDSSSRFIGSTCTRVSMTDGEARCTCTSDWSTRHSSQWDAMGRRASERRWN